MLIINHSQVRELLPMRDCMEVVEEALSALARGEGVQPLRSGFLLPDRQRRSGLDAGLFGCRPAVRDQGPQRGRQPRGAGCGLASGWRDDLRSDQRLSRCPCAKPARLPPCGRRRYPPWPPTDWLGRTLQPWPSWAPGPRPGRTSRRCSRFGPSLVFECGAGIRGQGENRSPKNKQPGMAWSSRDRRRRRIGSCRRRHRLHHHLGPRAHSLPPRCSNPGMHINAVGASIPSWREIDTGRLAARDPLHRPPRVVAPTRRGSTFKGCSKNGFVEHRSGHSRDRRGPQRRPPRPHIGQRDHALPVPRAGGGRHRGRTTGIPAGHVKLDVSALTSI